MPAWLFREPGRNEEIAEYVIPRAIVLFLVFVLAIMVLCVIDQYIPERGLFG